MDRITIDSEIWRGKKDIRGPRYPVESILELLVGGTSCDEILAGYEDLDREDIMAVTAYVARSSQVNASNSWAYEISD